MSWTSKIAMAPAPVLSARPQVDFLHPAAVADVLRPSGLEDLAEVQHRDLVGDAEDHVHVVLDQQDREGAVEPHEEFCHLLRLAGRESGGRLVEQQDFWVAGEAEDDLELTLLAMREMAHLDIAAVLEPRLLEEPLGLLVDVAIRRHEAPGDELRSPHSLD